MIQNYYDQTIFSNPSEGIRGDCYRACIGTLINVHPEQIPHFIQIDHNLENNSDIKWLDEHGFNMIRFTTFNTNYKILSGVVDHYLRGRLKHSCMVSGLSPRFSNIGHAVIWDHEKEIIFDPHPSRAGLVWNNQWWGFRFITPKSDTEDLDELYDFLNEPYYKDEDGLIALRA